MPHGRHARPSATARAVAAGTSAASGAALAGTALLSGHAAAAVPPPRPAAALPAQRAALDSALRYVVAPGDYLSAISARLCGTPADWTGIYAANRSLIGGNPDLILPGQALSVSCAAAAPPPAPGRAADHEPDGDADDPAPPQGGDPSGSLTRDQVGQLWLDAGGPAWAQEQAENVSYCESGWNTGAYNPSGATGLWQILGQVTDFGGSLYDARVNADNAVSKFEASGDSWAQWVCQP